MRKRFSDLVKDPEFDGDVIGAISPASGSLLSVGYKNQRSYPELSFCWDAFTELIYLINVSIFLLL